MKMMKKFKIFFLFTIFIWINVSDIQCKALSSEHEVPFSLVSVEVDGELDEWDDATHFSFTSADGDGTVDVYLKYDVIKELFCYAFMIYDSTGEKDDVFYIAFDTDFDGGNYPQDDDFIYGIRRGPWESGESNHYLIRGNGTDWDAEKIERSPRSSSIYPFEYGYWYQRWHDNGWRGEGIFNISISALRSMGFYIGQIDVSAGKSYYPEVVEAFEYSPDYWAVLTFSELGGSIVHELSVVSQYGSVAGEGTYPEGTTATFTVTPTQVEQDGERHTFTGWSSINRYGYTGPAQKASVVMLGDVREKAEWETKCYLTVYSEVPVDGEGWYADGGTVQLEADSPRGFLVRRVFEKWTGDVYSRDPQVSLVMNGARRVTAEWSTNYSQAILVGVLSAVLVGGRSYVTVRQRRREEETRATVERREREAQAAAELRKRIIGLVRQSGDVMVLGNLASSLNVSEDEVRVVIEEAVRGDALEGRFSNDGCTFIPDDVFRKIVKDKLKDERERK